MKTFYNLIFSAFLLLPFSAIGSETNDSKEFNASEMILHHIADAHEWHFWGEGENSFSLPLPVILWTDKGIVAFMSGVFHHDNEGKEVVNYNGSNFIRHHEKIYELNQGDQSAFFDDNHHIVNGVMPLDFSITKNVASMFISVFLMLFIFLGITKRYKKGPAAPKGFQSLIEPIIIFIRDDIAIPNVGIKHAYRFMPYLLTVFFFIWINNLLGLFPGGANFTGNISVTLVLAFITMLLTNINGNKHYWGHIFWMPGVPFVIKPLLALIEIAGVFIKPVALMIRLFANITAGHIIILSLLSLIFIFKSLALAPVSVGIVLFMNCLELLVAVLQAYIFTLLSALFIGMAVSEEH